MEALCGFDKNSTEAIYVHASLQLSSVSNTPLTAAVKLQQEVNGVLACLIGACVEFLRYYGFFSRVTSLIYDYNNKIVI